MDLIWRTSLGHQFQAAIDMLEQALLTCPDELWQARLWPEPEKPELAEFWYLAFHTLFWLDLYLSGGPQGFTPPAPFNLDELDPAGIVPQPPYARSELLSYLEHGRQKCQAKIAALTDERARELCHVHWGEVSYLELLLDNMRHVQEHGAQLNMFLGQQASQNSRWVSTQKE